MDQEGSLAAALASARASGSHPAPGLPIKGKMFAPHVPHNKNKKRQRMHGAQPRDSPGVKPNHNLQNDDFNQSNHNSWNNNCNDNPTNPNESQETALITDEAPRKKSKHWNHHISTNSKESREAISSSKRVGDKRSYSWHRKQTVQDTVEEDNAVAEQQIHSNLDTFSRHQDVTSNRMHFKGPSGISYSHVQDHDVQADPDSCYKLWNMLDAAYDARERCVRRKEEELAKREQAVQTQEEIVAHWKAQAQAERLEAAHMRQEAYAEWLRLDQEAKRIENLKADIEKIRGEILTKVLVADIQRSTPQR